MNTSFIFFIVIYLNGDKTFIDLKFINYFLIISISIITSQFNIFFNIKRSRWLSFIDKLLLTVQMLGV